MSCTKTSSDTARVLLVGASRLGAVELRVAPCRPRQRYCPLPGLELVSTRSSLFDHSDPCWAYMAP